MKFSKYLNELTSGELGQLKQLKKDVGINTLKIMDNRSMFLKRISDDLHGISLKKTYKDRKPLNTPLEYHTWADEWFEEEFGWRARSENVLFADVKKISWGNNIINNSFAFPVKPQKAVWSEKITDMTLDMSLNVLSDIDKEDFYIKLDNGKYKSAGFKEFLKKAPVKYYEVMIKCDKYWWINFDNFTFEGTRYILKYLGLSKTLKLLEK